MEIKLKKNNTESDHFDRKAKIEYALYKIVKIVTYIRPPSSKGNFLAKRIKDITNK